MTTIRTATEADADRIMALAQQAFNISSADQERRRHQMKFDQIMVVDDGGVSATTRAIPFGHYYGGRLVRGAGISGVAVAPEARGKGHGRTLVTEVLAKQRADGVAMSSLYPATVPIYRSLGYGYGGIRTTWKLDLDELPVEPGPEIETFADDDVPALSDAYVRIAQETNGLMERSTDWWVDILGRDSQTPKYRYLVREGDAVTGWIVYSLEKSKNDWRSSLSCRDLFFTTPGAARALIALGTLHRSTSASMSWTGPPSEPLGDITREDLVTHDGAFRYMVRLLDVPAALEARGYPAHVEAEVTIAVDDPLFPENAGPWRVSVSGGSAKVTPADEADARADVQTWASLWTSHRDARAARRTGGLEATEDVAAIIDAMFAGPSPWIADFF